MTTPDDIVGHHNWKMGRGVWRAQANARPGLVLKVHVRPESASVFDRNYFQNMLT